MNRIATLSLGTILVLSLVSGCTPKASQEECLDACSKFANLNLAATPATAPAQPDTASLDEQIQALQAEQTQALVAVGAELEGKIAAAKLEEEKTALSSQLKALQEQKTQEFLARISALNDQKAQGLKVFEDARAAAEESAKKSLEGQTASCATSCVEQKSGKSLVECQIKATSLEEYKACK